jgi:hypothetical protein
MPGPLLHVQALTNCPHGGSVQAPPSNTKVLVGGRLVLTLADVITVAGCAFTVPGPKPQPCVLVKVEAATKVTVNFKPAVILTATALCQSAEQAPQGPPMAGGIQSKVIAT